ncbi:MAG: sigma-70 family RNA polymerase sigma factor [Planctomycetes bacterium]|nr:sigma-70 family RNA polymerase sigma factor [Planctomycetota bacterium]
MQNAFANNPEAWERFTRLWVTAQPALSTFISTVVVNAADAEDVLQNVALTAARDFESYDPSRPFLPWAMTIARHRVIDHHRQRSRQGSSLSPQTVEQLASVCEQTLSAGDEHARMQALRVCMNTLPDKQRRMLSMRYHEDWSGAKIAQAMGMSVNAVFLMLSRLRSQLAECIDRRLRKIGDA